MLILKAPGPTQDFVAAGLLDPLSSTVLFLRRLSLRAS